MNRNISKMSDEGRRIIANNIHYELVMNDIQAFFEIYRKAATYIDGVYDVIVAAYRVGFASGHRCGTRKNRKNQTAANTR